MPTLDTGVRRLTARNSPADIRRIFLLQNAYEYPVGDLQSSVIYVVLNSGVQVEQPLQIGSSKQNIHYTLVTSIYVLYSPQSSNAVSDLSKG